MLDLEPIRARQRAYEEERSDDIMPMCESAGDVPALIAEVERLRDLAGFVVSSANTKRLLGDPLPEPMASRIRALADATGWGDLPTCKVPLSASTEGATNGL